MSLWMILTLWFITSALGGIMHGENQTIIGRYKGAFLENNTWFPMWDWWNQVSKQYDNPFINWLVKYPFAIFRDGFHFTSGIAWWLVTVVPSTYLMVDMNFEWYFIILGHLEIMLIYGIFANISLHDWLRI